MPLPVVVRYGREKAVISGNKCFCISLENEHQKLSMRWIRGFSYLLAARNRVDACKVPSSQILANLPGLAE